MAAQVQPTWLERAAARWPRELAVASGSRALTYLELLEEVSQVVRALRLIGLGPGERMAVIARPRLEYAHLLHAAHALGAVLVPLSTRQTPRELAEQLASCRPLLVLADAEGARLCASALSGDVTAGEGYFVPPPAGWPLDELRYVRKFDAGEQGPGEQPCFPCGRGEADTAGGSRQRASGLSAALASRGALTIVFTSGTSGRAKPIVLSAGNHQASAEASCKRVPLGPGDRWLSVVPMHHVAGISILVRAVLTGAAVVVAERFDAAEAVALLTRQRVSHISLVPTMLARMLNEGLERTASVRCVLVGGGPLGQRLFERALARGLPLYPTYGMTETASQIATATPSDCRQAGLSAGRPLAGLEVRIARAAHLAGDERDAGEILVRGPQVACGKIESDGSVVPVTDAEGWLHTGDIGRIDREGRLHVLARRTDLIVTGGENVLPAEVEEVLREHPDVVDAGVAGLADELWGQRVAAAVVVREGAAVEPQALIAWCRQRLAPYKVPRSVVLIGALPRTPSGKLRRQALAAALRAAEDKQKPQRKEKSQQGRRL